MTTLLQDVRYGARALGRARAFTAAAVLALALGIGANTAIFSVVNAVLLRPLPFTDPERLITVWEDYSAEGRSVISAGEVAAYGRREDLLEGLAVLDQVTFNLRGEGEPEQVRGALVSASLFPLLGVSAAPGRVFVPEEDRAGRGQVVLLSNELWRGRFGGDPGVVGRSVTLDMNAGFGPPRSRPETFTVVGVLPAGFRVPFLDEGVEIWAPLALDAGLLADENHYLFALGKLRRGVAVERAQEELRGISAALDPAGTAHSGRSWRVDVVPLTEVVVGDVRPALLLLLAAVGFVLLTACANVANLLLARASARRREFAVRAALGARPLRIVRQLVTESALLALLGGAGGLVLATWGVGVLAGLAPDDLPRLDEVGVDGRVLLFTLGVSLLTALLFGLAPAVQASRPDVREALLESGRGVRGDRGGALRSALVVSEIALALLLLVGAGLLLKSFARLRDVEPGFEPKGALTMHLSLPRARYPERSDVEAFYRQLLSDAEALPGVEVGATTSSLPLSGWNSAMPVLGVNGRPLSDAEASTVSWRSVSPDYFRAMGTRLLGGRHLTDADLKGQSADVVVVNRMLARTYWPDRDPIGARIQLPLSDEGEQPWLTVVGVVEDVIDAGPELAPGPMLYFAGFQRDADLVLRTASEPLSLAPGVRRAVLRLDPDRPVSEVGTLEQRLERATAGSRFNALALAVFASLAVVLAAVGIYGIVAYAVTQRTSEIGLRLALGAKRSDVLRMVLAAGLRLAGVGVIVGLAAAFLLGRVLAGLLYGVAPTDPAVLAGVALLLGIVALTASALPALRATRLDPLQALRSE